MRFELVALFATGCELLDISQPIAIIASDLTADDTASLEEAAQCWNLNYGTQFVFGDAEQQVEAFYDEQTCLIGAAQVQAGWPLRIGVCPPRYWNGIRADRDTGVITTPFRVFSHELGHVLNINGHPSEDPYATMRSGNKLGTTMFTDADTEILAEFNAGFAPIEPACKRVTRSLRIGSQGNVGRCGCEQAEALDLSRPIVIALDSQFIEPQITTFRNAADCWNLHYGLSISVGAPAPGDQVAYVEPVGVECRDTTFNGGRARDGDSVVVCAYPDLGVAGGMRAIGDILGVSYGSVFEASNVFGESYDRRFAELYPNQPVPCRYVRASGSPSVCSCVP